FQVFNQTWNFFPVHFFQIFSLLLPENARHADQTQDQAAHAQHHQPFHTAAPCGGKQEDMCLSLGLLAKNSMPVAYLTNVDGTEALSNSRPACWPLLYITSRARKFSIL